MTDPTPEMTAKSAVEIIQLLVENGIDLCVDGGWAVDALLGEQTRRHNDLDIAMPHKDAGLIRALLEQRGFQEVPRDDTRDCNWVMGDAHGRQVDIHTYTFDETGRCIFGVEYPFDSLNGSGEIAGYRLKCISPEWLVKFHTGYPLDENDYHDVKALCQHFDLALPTEYDRFSRTEATK